MLKAKLVIVAILTPLLRVRVSNTSAGMIQLSGPQVQLKLKLYSHVMIMKPHCAPMLVDTPGGYFASKMVAMMKVTMLHRLP